MYTIRVKQKSVHKPPNTEYTELAHSSTPLTPLTTPPTTPGLAPLLFPPWLSLGSMIKGTGGDLLI